MFIGQSGGALIVGGGLDESGQPSADVFVQTDSGWKKLALRQPVAFGGFVCGPLRKNSGAFSKLFIAGGVTKDGLTDKVFSLEWRDGQLQQNELPPLPQAVALAGVGFFEDQAQKQLYVVGGTTSTDCGFRVTKIIPLHFRTRRPIPAGRNCRRCPAKAGCCRA